MIDAAELDSVHMRHTSPLVDIILTKGPNCGTHAGIAMHALLSSLSPHDRAVALSYVASMMPLEIQTKRKH